MNKKILSTVLMFLAVTVLTARVSFAMDPLEAAPEMYKLKHENDHVRVMEVTFQPGEKIAEHSHPDHFVYVLEGGNLQITRSDNSVTDAALNVGDIIWIDSETHWAVNTGTTVVRLLVTELKETKPIVEAVK